MKRILGIVVLAFIVVSISISGVSAEHYSTRAFGMGGAYTGIADDVSSIIYNPAGLSQSGFLGLEFNGGVSTEDISKMTDITELVDYMSSKEDFNAEELYDKIPESIGLDMTGVLGANLKQFGLAFNLLNNFNVYKDEIAKTGGVENETTTEGIVSIARDLNNPPGELLALSYGVNVKMMKTDYNKYFLDLSGANGTTSEISASGNGFGLDAGVMARVSDVLKVGAEIRNLWAADYTITGEEKEFAYDAGDDEWNLQDTNDYEKEIHPESKLRVGASLNVPVINTLIAADIDNFAGEGEQIFHLGMEKNLLWNGISLRVGTYNQGDDTIYTAGMGLNLAAFHLDMALGTDSKFENSVGGMISFKTKF